jgi:hypothetical protein
MKTVVPQQDTIDALDFDHKPRCEKRLLVSRRIRIVLHRCRRQAAWAAHHPCCGAVSYLCKQHRILKPPCWCGVCNADLVLDQMKWVRL